MFSKSYQRVYKLGLNTSAVVFVVLVLAMSSDAMAHNSVEKIENQIKDDERYMQLTDKIAPNFIFQDTEGKEIRLEDFLGKVVILNFLYSRCKEECPLHSAKLATIQRQLANASLSTSVQFITIATDTEDSVSTLRNMKEHGSRYGLDASNWKFLYGGPGKEDLGRRMADAFGLKFVPTADGVQMHGVVTYLIDGDRRIRARYHGLKFDPVNLTVHAAALVHGDHSNKKSKNKSFITHLLKNYWISILVVAMSLGFLVWLLMRKFREKHRVKSIPTYSEGTD